MFCPERAVWRKSASHLVVGTLLMLGLGQVQAKDRETPPPHTLHAIRGRVIPIGGQPLRAAKVQLSGSDERKIGEKLLTYEGTFAFEGLLPGQYILTLEREDEATIGRPVEIKSYPSAKVVFLEVTLNKESASVRELVTDASNPDFGTLKAAPSQVSRRALREFEQASKESAAGSPAKAIVHLQKAIREQPDYFEAHNNLGVQYQKQRQWDDAIRSYRRAIEIQPNSAKAHVNLAAVFLELGQIESALDSLDAARKAEPGSAQVHLALGQIYLRRQDYVRAQESLETTTRLSPKDSRQAFGLLIQIAMRHNDLDRAKQYLDLMKQYFPSDPETLKQETAIQSAIER